MLTAKKKLAQQLASTFHITRNLIRHSKYIKLLIAAMLTVVLVAGTVQAKELYVNSGTGSDSTTYANNDSENPWATLGRAVWGSTNRDSPDTGECAQPGDTVIVAAGTYTMAGLSNWETNRRSTPVYNPAVSGTSENYITFQAENPASTNSSDQTILQTETLNGAGQDGQPVIGTDQRDYIVWDGFYIDEADNSPHSDTGPVVVWDSEYVYVKNCEIIGAGASVTYDDNHKGIGIQGNSNYVWIQNNKIHGFYQDGGSNDEKGCGLQVYNSWNTTVENNEFYDNAGGAFFKELIRSAHGTHTIRYNLFYDHSKTDLTLYRIDQNQTVDVYQNIFRDSVFGVKFYGFDGGDPANCDVVNNTFDNHSTGAVYLSGANEYTNNRFYNNIITNASYAFYGPDVTAVSNMYNSTGKISIQHHTYHDVTTFGIFSYRNISLSAWKSTYGQDSVSPEAITSDPTYTNEGNNDFTLQEGSPCEDFGIDILDLDKDSATDDVITVGAYITGDEVIGIDSGGSEPPPPSVPSPPPSVPSPPSGLHII